MVSTSGVNERTYPSTDASVRGVLARGQRIGLRCKVRAQNIGPHDTWYLLRDRTTWVSAAHVSPTGAVPLCREVSRPAPEQQQGVQQPQQQNAQPRQQQSTQPRQQNMRPRQQQGAQPHMRSAESQPDGAQPHMGSEAPPEG
ncbi:SH3 domain-containing protein [Streptomyces gamaensis]|uniref:SH3 domain-containing protein n=1 Tax=Streptomyces gamaensis TaxID=1763542 RepID=A0ABW0Z517_9ACTN